VPWCGTCSSRRSPLGKATRDRRIGNPLPAPSVQVTGHGSPGGARQGEPRQGSGLARGGFPHRSGATVRVCVRLSARKVLARSSCPHPSPASRRPAHASGRPPIPAGPGPRPRRRAGQHTKPAQPRIFDGGCAGTHPLPLLPTCRSVRTVSQRRDSPLVMTPC
jgi:hypothetical protein